MTKIKCFHQGIVLIDVRWSSPFLTISEECCQHFFMNRLRLLL